MTTTEAALREALEKCLEEECLDDIDNWLLGGGGWKFMRAAAAKLANAAILSQPPASSTVAQEVRPLRWCKPSDHPCDREDALWMAMGYGGRYAIQEDGGHFIVWMADDEFTFEQGDSVDACKGIAERHWQEQIGRLRLSPSSGEPASVAVEAEPIAWRVDDLTSKGALCGSFALYSDYGAVQRHVRNGGIAHTKVTPLYPALSKPTPVEAGLREALRRAVTVSATNCAESGGRKVIVYFDNKGEDWPLFNLLSDLSGLPHKEEATPATTTEQPE